MMLHRVQITLICAMGLALYTQEGLTLPNFNYRTHGVIGGLAVTAAVCTVVAISNAYKASCLAYDINNDKETLQQLADAKKMAQGLEAKPGNASLLKQHVEKMYQTQDGDNKNIVLKKRSFSREDHDLLFSALTSAIDSFIKRKKDQQVRLIQEKINDVDTAICQNMHDRQSKKTRAIILASVNSLLALGGGLGAFFYNRMAQ